MEKNKIKSPEKIIKECTGTDISKPQPKAFYVSKSALLKAMQNYADQFKVKVPEEVREEAIECIKEASLAKYKMKETYTITDDSVDALIKKGFISTPKSDSKPLYAMEAFGEWAKKVELPNSLVNGDMVLKAFVAAYNPTLQLKPEPKSDWISVQALTFEEFCKWQNINYAHVKTNIDDYSIAAQDKYSGYLLGINTPTPDVNREMLEALKAAKNMIILMQQEAWSDVEEKALSKIESAISKANTAYRFWVVEYTKRVKWTEPILEYMALQNKKMKTIDIAIGIEPKFEMYCKKDKEYIIDKISYALHNLNKKNKVTKEPDAKKGYLWSINWIK